jgi:hypothetical protein
MDCMHYDDACLLSTDNDDRSRPRALPVPTGAALAGDRSRGRLACIVVGQSIIDLASNL